MKYVQISREAANQADLVARARILFLQSLQQEPMKGGVRAWLVQARAWLHDAGQP